ncbi:MAG: Uncharacterised protein [Polaribacter sp. SA4-10]|nr:MAG: Uncharacterised protein [Polaribacter sp. SA4-10]
MKKALLFFGIFMVTSFSTQAQKPAYELANIFYGIQIDQVTKSIGEITPDDQKKKLSQKSIIEKETILKKIAAVYTTSFSFSEMQRILTFYNSALGKKWTAEKGALNAKASELFMKWEMKKFENQ